MSTIVITGAASGIGAATRARLESDGHEVIGVDLRDVEVVADLSTPEGRDAMVEGVTERSGGAVDGLVAAAGVMNDDPVAITRINYFGAVATLTGIRPLMAGRPGASAVVLSSNSAIVAPESVLPLVEACLTGDEAAAVEQAAQVEGTFAYPAGKLALARWVRRQAVTEDWIGAGIRLNAIAPGVIDTPMTKEMQEYIFSLGEVFPVPIQRAGTAAEAASLITYLLSQDAGFFCGSFITMDGGTEAALRAEHWPAPVG